MDFLESMVRYYQSEYKAGFFIGAFVGGILLAGAILLWKFANPLSLLKGLTIPLLVAGIFMGLAGSGSGYFTKKSYAEKVKLYQKDKHEFFKQEVPKVERTHKSWFGIRLMWSIVLGAGALLMLTAKKDYVIGVGLGIVLFGIIGHIEEAISFKRNEKYHDAVLKAASAGITGNVSREKSKTEVTDLVRNHLNPYPRPTDHTMKLKTIKPTPENDNLVADSLKTLVPLESVREVVINMREVEISKIQSPVISRIPDSIQAYNHDSRTVDYTNTEISELAKDKRFGDYSGAILIGKENKAQKSCWFKRRGS